MLEIGHYLRLLISICIVKRDGVSPSPPTLKTRGECAPPRGDIFRIISFFFLPFGSSYRKEVDFLELCESGEKRAPADCAKRERDTLVQRER